MRRLVGGLIVGSLYIEEFFNHEIGVLKGHVATTHRTVSSKLHAYFGHRVPSLQLRAPNMPAFLNGGSFEQLESSPLPSGKLHWQR